MTLEHVNNSKKLKKHPSPSLSFSPSSISLSSILSPFRLDSVPLPAPFLLSLSLPSVFVVRIFVPFDQLYIHPFSFCSQSFHSSDSISPFPSSPCSFPFLSSIPLLSCTLPFHPFCLQTLPLSFPLSLSACSSYIFLSLCYLAFLCPLLAPLSNIFPALSLPSLVLSILSLLLKSPPHFLSPILHTHSTTLFAFLTVSLLCALSVALWSQVFELAHSFYFPSFPLSLILFILPLSLVEQHHFFHFFGTLWHY
jgi:hypothetical protein